MQQSQPTGVLGPHLGLSQLCSCSHLRTLRTPFHRAPGIAKLRRCCDWTRRIQATGTSWGPSDGGALQDGPLGVQAVGGDPAPGATQTAKPQGTLPALQPPERRFPGTALPSASVCTPAPPPQGLLVVLTAAPVPVRRLPVLPLGPPFPHATFLNLSVPTIELSGQKIKVGHRVKRPLDGEKGRRI